MDTSPTWRQAYIVHGPSGQREELGSLSGVSASAQRILCEKQRELCSMPCRGVGGRQSQDHISVLPATHSLCPSVKTFTL